MRTRFALLSLCIVAGCADAPTRRSEPSTDAKTAPTERVTASSAVVDAEEGKRRLQGEPPQFDVGAAARSFERACDAGHLESCAKLGLQVQDGRGVARDPARALELYERACAGGVGVGCFNLGLWYQGGRGGPDADAIAPRHFARALAAYGKQCSGDRPTYCENLGYLYEVGMEVAVDAAAAEAAYRRGCDADGQVACLQLGLLELASGRDAQAAVRRLETACTRSVAEACGAIGERQLSGLAPYTRDVERGLANLDRGCLLGSGASCQHLAAALLGERGEAGRADAELKLERGCSLGASSACHHLATGAVGRGDDAATLALFRRACDIGHAVGCRFLAGGYRNGRGVDADPMRALELFEDACHLGDFVACIEVDKAGRPLGLSPAREAKLRAAAAEAKVPLSTR